MKTSDMIIDCGVYVNYMNKENEHNSPETEAIIASILGEEIEIIRGKDALYGIRELYEDEEWVDFLVLAQNTASFHLVPMLVITFHGTHKEDCDIQVSWNHEFRRGDTENG